MRPQARAVGQHAWAFILILFTLLLLGFKVEFRIDYGSGKIDFRDSVEMKKGETVFDLLKKEKMAGKIDFTYKDFGKLGALIESIDGRKNGKGRKYWKFWVNGKFSLVGASNSLLKNKDRVMWRYAK